MWPIPPQMIANLNTSYLVGTAPTSLLDLMPDPTSDNGIFAYLSSLPYIDPPSNNIEYLYNRSGDKLPSPLVTRLADGDTLTSTSLQSLARIITTRFQHKWNRLWEDYSSTSSLFQTLSTTSTTTYGKSTSSTGTDTTTHTGTETNTRRGTETKDETFPQARKSTRTISGSYTDTRDITQTRSGTENTTESYPTARTSTKSITGSYADADTTSNTRTGTQTVTDRGDTSTSVYGFNSTTPVKTQTTGPDTSTTTETSYGQGLVDTKSGAVTRTYNNYSEATAETGSRQLSTSYGENGLSDAEDGTVTRTYNNYVDETSETGSRRTETSYGSAGITDEKSYSNRQDATASSSSISNSGTDSTSISGYNIHRLSDKSAFLALLYSDPLIHNFYEIVYRDIDEVLTINAFV